VQENPKQDHDASGRDLPPLNIDAYDADWIKGDRVRLGDDGAYYIRDLTVPGGTRRIAPGTAEHDELRSKQERGGER
jgi:hypothetical protein